MKTLKLLPTLICIVLCSLTSNLFSQDVIFLLNGNEIEAKIIKVEDAEIEYKQWSNQDGPTFTEKTNNIFVIKYQNGEKKVFNTVNKKNNMFIGVNVGLGYGGGWSDGFVGTLGLDIVFPTSDKFAIGSYISSGYDSGYEEFISNLGVLSIIGDRSKSAFMIGQGVTAAPDGDPDWGTSTRIGFTIHDMYVFGEYSYLPGYWTNHNAFLLHVGFKLR